MSVSAVSSNPQIYQPGLQQQSFRQDLQSLTTAVQSGDLASAQKAFISKLFRIWQRTNGYRPA